MAPEALGRRQPELVELTQRFPPQLRNVTYQQMAEDSLSDLANPLNSRQRERLINDLLASTKGFEHFDLSPFSKDDPGAAYEFARRVADVIEWIAHNTSQPFAFAPSFEVIPGFPVYVSRASHNRLRLKQSPLQSLYEKFRTALETLDPSRVRLCDACKAVFWAHRKDQAACSKACANRARVRRWYAQPDHAKRVKEEKRKSRDRSAKKAGERGKP
jgi:hypothetical protein